jgi:hypothetical protein
VAERATASSRFKLAEMFIENFSGIMRQFSTVENRPLRKSQRKKIVLTVEE